MKISKILIIAGIILSIALSVIITTNITQIKQILFSKAAASTKLSFTPANISAAPDETFTADIQVDSGENHLSAIELHVTFDQNLLTITGLTAGDFFDNPVNLVDPVYDNSKGTADFIIGSQPGKDNVGEGVVAKINFQVVGLTDASTTVNFTEATKVVGTNERSSVLVSTSSLKVDIVLPTPTPTPTATYSPTPSTISPTATPIIDTPTVMISPTMSPSISMTITPTNIPQPSPSALPQAGSGWPIILTTFISGAIIFISLIL